jgi:hypothetical protein
VVAETEFKLLVATAEGLMPAVAVAPVAAVVGLVVGVATGRGCDIGVSYRIYAVMSLLFVTMRIWCGRTDAMNKPNMAPRPPPITPAIIVLPKQDSMPICIYLFVSQTTSLSLPSIPSRAHPVVVPSSILRFVGRRGIAYRFHHLLFLL